jgi:SAM-dependent MidA family methyltransferase
MPAAEPFSTFMARALYDPQQGYYTKHIRTVGARGDFSTSATLSSLLGVAVAAWLKEEQALMPHVRHIIEVGAGDGSLMATVQKSLGWWTRRRFQFHIVETSPVLRTRQQERLTNHTTWHETMTEALTAASGQAFIYHNEVLDAFPLTLIQWHEGQWHEVFVASDDQRHIREELHPITLDSSTTLSNWQPPHPKQRCEWHASVHQWLHEWSPHWTAGSMLTIDYGDVFPALYHRRPMGTLRAYLLQQRLEGASIYANPGRQDLTADVNFTDYRAWAQALGFEEVAYGTQADFISARTKPQPNDAANAFLLNEHGAGHAFKHVIHRRLRK